MSAERFSPYGAGPGRKDPTMCGDFQRGVCHRGDRCKFSHGQELCGDFSRGACQRGDRCKFSHSFPRRVEEVCGDFQRGLCNRGENCKFRHEGGGGPILRGPGRPDCKLELYIPIAKCGLLVGKGGVVFKQLQKDFGVALQVPHQDNPDGTLTIVEGPEDRVDACHDRIHEAVHGDLEVVSKTGGDRRPYGKGAPRPVAPGPPVWGGKGATAPPPRQEPIGRGPARLYGAERNGSGTSHGPLARTCLKCGHGFAGDHQMFCERCGAKREHQAIKITTVPQQYSILESFKHPKIGVLARAGSQTGEEGSQIRVANLPGDFDELALYVLFAPFGAINSVYVSREPRNPERHTGTGYVRYASSLDADQAAFEMQDTIIATGMPALDVSIDDRQTTSGSQVANDPATEINEGKIKLELAIPIQRCGLLIGAGGFVFKELVKKFGVDLKVPRSGDPEGTLTEIVGPREAAEACADEIAEKVKGECEVVSSAADVPRS